MTITARIVDEKRHTLGFVVDGRIVTRHAAVRLVEKGEICVGKKNPVFVCKGKHGKYIATYRFAATRLYDLPVLVDAR